MSLNGKTFRAFGNSSHGTLNTETRMTFVEDATDVTAVYSGGTIRAGNVVAQRTGESALEMLYHCITTDSELKAGRASASFARDSAGRDTMHLDWAWLTGDRATGSSDWVLEAP